MNNNQYQSVGPTSFNYDARPQASSKSKFVIIGLIVVAIVALILVAVFIISKNQNNDYLPDGRENSAVLQIYAALEDEIPISEIETTVKNINSAAVVTIEDGYGTIELSDDTKEFISFYFETEESTNEELLDGESLADLDESYENYDDGGDIKETHDINIAYGFVYVHEISDDDGITVSCASVCYYYDGLDIYEFPTKQEAIDAYLAPVFE